jgi:hypothetical protein
LLDCLFAINAFWRLRDRKKDSRVISETGDELLDIESSNARKNFRVNDSIAVRSADGFAGSMANANGADAVKKAIAVTTQALLIIGIKHDT